MNWHQKNLLLSCGQLKEVVNSDPWISRGKILIFKASFYKENNKRLKLDMTKQFYSDAIFCNQLQNILGFCLKNTQIWKVAIRFFRSNFYVSCLNGTILCMIKPAIQTFKSCQKLRNSCFALWEMLWMSGDIIKVSKT